MFLYWLNENQIDMLINFDNGILSYSIVEKKFDTSIHYTAHLNFMWSGTQVQIAKINVDVIGEKYEN